MANSKRVRTNFKTKDDYTNHFLSHFGFHDYDRKNQSSPIETYYWIDQKQNSNGI